MTNLIEVLTNNNNINKITKTTTTKSTIVTREKRNEMKNSKLLTIEINRINAHFHTSTCADYVNVDFAAAATVSYAFIEHH